MYILACYIGHLAISLIATVWVAQTLVRNGRAFLVDAFHGNVELADSVNHLLVVAHQLPSHDGAQRDRAVCDKFGFVLMVL